MLCLFYFKALTAQSEDSMEDLTDSDEEGEAKEVLHFDLFEFISHMHVHEIRV